MANERPMEMVVNDQTYEYVWEFAKKDCAYSAFEAMLAERRNDGKEKAHRIFTNVLRRIAYQQKYGYGAYSSGQIADIVIENEDASDIIGPEELSQYIDEWEESCWREIAVLGVIFDSQKCMSVKPLDKDGIQQLIEKADEILDFNSQDEGE